MAVRAVCNTESTPCSENGGSNATSKQPGSRCTCLCQSIPFRSLFKPPALSADHYFSSFLTLQLNEYYFDTMDEVSAHQQLVIGWSSGKNAVVWIPQAIIII